MKIRVADYLTEKLADAENSITELQLALVELCESVGV